MLQHLAAAAGLQQPVQPSGGVPERALVARESEEVEVLVRIVEDGVEMAHEVREPVVDGGNGVPERAAHLARGVGGGVRRLRVDEVHDGFGLGEVHAAVEEGALCKFAGPGLPCPGGEQGLEARGQHGGGAVALQLHGVLTGVAAGSAGVDGQHLVDDAALDVQQCAARQRAVGRFRERAARGGPEHPPGHGGGVVAGEAQDPDGAGLTARGHGGNDI